METKIKFRDLSMPLKIAICIACLAMGLYIIRFAILFIISNFITRF